MRHQEWSIIALQSCLPLKWSHECKNGCAHMGTAKRWENGNVFTTERLYNETERKLFIDRYCMSPNTAAANNFNVAFLFSSTKCDELWDDCWIWWINFYVRLETFLASITHARKASIATCSSLYGCSAPRLFKAKLVALWQLLELLAGNIPGEWWDKRTAFFQRILLCPWAHPWQGLIEGSERACNLHKYQNPILTFDLWPKKGGR